MRAARRGRKYPPGLTKARSELLSGRLSAGDFTVEIDGRRQALKRRGTLERLVGVQLESFGDGTLRTEIEHAPAASKCYNRPNDADSWRNHKNIFAIIFPLKSKV
jgi:hypothetical protein